ncbi:MAG TPA: hypothetical protein VGX69_08005 [Solirubrobacteraceae bacterium]|nr:hypothetical protein [Solirubrobacteraceae bacterium]
MAVGLFAANMLGVAVAEAPTSTTARTLAVQGVAVLPIGQSDNAAAATAVYREAMAAAVTDGQSKAAFLAGKVGATPTQVQNVVEDGGYIQCTAPGESGYAQYEGEEPDFGSAPQTVVAAPAATARSSVGVAAPLAAKPKRKKGKRPTAKRAVAGSCKLTAQVSLVYTIG